MRFLKEVISFPVPWFPNLQNKNGDVRTHLPMFSMLNKVSKAQHWDCIHHETTAHVSILVRNVTVLIMLSLTYVQLG